MVKTDVMDLFKPDTTVYTVLVCKMVKIDPSTGEEKEDTVPFKSGAPIPVFKTDYDEIYNEMVEGTLEKFSMHQRNGSGWSLKSVVNLDIYMTTYNPLKGSLFVELSKEPTNKKALTNVKNSDEECFKCHTSS